MAILPSIHPRVIDALYTETLVLADEVRTQFDRSRRTNTERGAGDLARLALSCEALRTTTRLMHCLAWLLNHRAYFAGEISALQLRRHGRLVASVPASDPENRHQLSSAMVRLIDDSERLYARVARLERMWRGDPDGPSAIERLRERLAANGVHAA